MLVFEEREIGVPGENFSVQDWNQQTQSTFDAGPGNRTRATLVGGECSHHCAIPAPPRQTKLKCCTKVRETRAAQLLFLIQPIRSLFFDVVLAVAVGLT